MATLNTMAILTAVVATAQFVPLSETLPNEVAQTRPDTRELGPAPEATADMIADIDTTAVPHRYVLSVTVHKWLRWQLSDVDVCVDGR